MASTADLHKPLKKRKAVEINVKLGTNKAVIDFQEWIGSLVLARYGSGLSVYRPGKIVSCPSADSIAILLDKQSEPMIYSGILNTLDVLGNHPPAAMLVTEGIAVCVKEKQDDNVFVVAKVKEVNAGPPLKCLVESENLPNDVWVNRANIRLMQPPWYDELKEASLNHVVSYFTEYENFCFK